MTTRSTPRTATHATALTAMAALLVVGTAGCFDPTADGAPLGYENSDDACTDGRDNDRDGFVDCEDIDCVAHAQCGETVIEGQ
ncbi:MAG: hypothetical protein R3A78_04360, partial [Polyangiales bacterium]